MRIDYVGTRGLHEPFQVGLNGYQTVCAGCFAPYPYAQPLDQRFGSVNEFRTDASSNYSGLQASLTEQLAVSHAARQLHFQPLPRRGLERRPAPVFNTGDSLARCPASSAANTATATTTCATTSPPSASIAIPFSSRHAPLRALFRNWSFSETAFLHYRLAVHRAQPALHGRRQRRLSGQLARSLRAAYPGEPLYRKSPIPGVTVAGTRQWLNPDAFVSVVDPTTGACTGGDSAANCQFGDCSAQHRARAALH